MEVKKVSLVEFWIWKIGIRLFFLLFHIPLSIIYWNKGRKVPPIKNALLLKSATKLASEIRKGKLKSVDVVQAYIERILEVQPYINALAENRFEDALKDAKEADKLVEAGIYTVRQLEENMPLLGVPFTTKVLLTIKGMPCTAASILFKDAVAGEDAPSISLVKKAGGIVLATTNSAELGLGFDTINNLYGKTCNPYDTSKTPGGSSGGESALLGAAGSLIGLGNDITGSIRVPAHFTGVFAHKASFGVISNEGSFPTANPKQAKYLYTGPMCRYSEDLITMMKILTSKNSVIMKFGKPVNFKNLKIYYQFELKDPAVLPVDKEIVAAMKKAIAHFIKNYGVTAKEVDINLLNLSNKINFHLLLADVENIAKQTTAGKVKHLNGILEFLKFLIGKSIFSLWAIFEIGFGKWPIFFKDEDVPLYQKLLQKLDKKFEELLDENSVFFYPTLPAPAPHYYEMIPLLFSTVYTGIFNFLGLPVTQCPLGLNRKGMPHGMQIISRKNNDPLTLACAEELSKVFGGWIPPS